MHMCCFFLSDTNCPNFPMPTKKGRKENQTNHYSCSFFEYSFKCGEYT